MKFYNWAIRLSFSIVYVWFGILKIFNVSGATLLISDLLHYFNSFFPTEIFIIFFGVVEIYIGIIFLFPRITNFALIAASFHLILSALPLIVLPEHTWKSSFVLTQTGQYIIKNIFIVSGLIGLKQSITKSRG